MRNGDGKKKLGSEKFVQKTELTFLREALGWKSKSHWFISNVNLIIGYIYWNNFLFKKIISFYFHCTLKIARQKGQSFSRIKAKY